MRTNLTLPQWIVLLLRLYAFTGTATSDYGTTTATATTEPGGQSPVASGQVSFIRDLGGVYALNKLWSRLESIPSLLSLPTTHILILGQTAGEHDSVRMNTRLGW